MFREKKDESGSEREKERLEDSCILTCRDAYLNIVITRFYTYLQLRDLSCCLYVKYIPLPYAPLARSTQRRIRRAELRNARAATRKSFFFFLFLFLFFRITVISNEGRGSIDVTSTPERSMKGGTDLKCIYYSESLHNSINLSENALVCSAHI